MAMERRFVFTGKNMVELEKFTPAVPAAEEVAVENIATMLSPGTEGIVFSRNFALGTHWDNWVKYPFYPGYAAVGRVFETGGMVTAMKPGDRVVYRGGHASMGIEKADNCYLVPDGISNEDALWFAIAKIAAMGAKVAEYKLGSRVAVIGAGPIGQFSARWAYAAGAWVTVLDVAETRFKYLRSGGKFNCLSGSIAGLAEVNPEIIIDTTGNAKVFSEALDVVGKFGKLVLLGDTGNPESQHLTGSIITKGLTVIGAHDLHENAEWNSRIIIDLFFRLCLDGRISVTDMISHRFGPENPAEIYRICMEERNEIMGMIVNWE